MKSETPPSPATRDAEGMTALEWAASQGGLPPTQFAFLVRMATISTDWRLSAKQAEIGAHFGLNERQCRNVINGLLSRGLVRRIRRGGFGVGSLASVYILNEKDPHPEQRPVREPITAQTRYTVLKAFGFRCARCQVSASDQELDIDHIVPVCVGGTNARANLQPLCEPCHVSKSREDLHALADAA